MTFASCLSGITVSQHGLPSQHGLQETLYFPTF